MIAREPSNTSGPGPEYGEGGRDLAILGNGSGGSVEDCVTQSSKTVLLPVTRYRGWLLILLVAGVVIRAAFWFVYEPIWHPDSATYFTHARYLLTGDFTGYEGRRTPGYPALVALAGMSPAGTWALQMLCGLAISVLLFHVTMVATGRPRFAAIVGMSYNLNLAQLFFEANLLSETLSTLSVVSCLAMLIAAYRRLQGRRPVVVALLIVGVLGGIATLVRPQFILLPLVLPLLIAFESFGGARYRAMRALWHATLTGLPGVSLVLAWAAFNYAMVGQFTVTTQLGIGLMAHSLPLIESAPDRYATIRDIYVKHRDAKILETGQHFAMWDAIPELTRETGLPLPALSRELQWLSVSVFIRQPLRYGAGVARAWVDFWLAPNYWKLTHLRSPSLAAALHGLWRLEHPLVRLFNLVFLTLVAVALIVPPARVRIGSDPVTISVAGIVLAASLIPAITHWGENARYGIPVQSLVIAGVMIGIHHLCTRSARTTLSWLTPLPEEAPRPPVSRVVGWR